MMKKMTLGRRPGAKVPTAVSYLLSRSLLIAAGLTLAIMAAAHAADDTHIDGKWVDAAGRSCLDACAELKLQPFRAGHYRTHTLNSPDSIHYLICRARRPTDDTLSTRPGFQHPAGSKTRCRIWGATDLQQSIYDCLCR